MAFWKWVMIGAMVGLIAQTTGAAQVFPNIIAWGHVSGTTYKPFAVDVNGKLIPG